MESLIEQKLIDGAMPVRRSTNLDSAPRRWKCFLCRRLTTAVIVTVLVVAFGALEAQAQTTPFPEYEVKAAFLFNFAQFIE